MNVFEALDLNAHLDNDLLRLNDSKGDVFDTPRDVEFAFKTTDEEKARDIADFIKAKNFGHPSINQGDDGVLWVIVVIHMAINQNLICSISGFMVCLSRLFKVEYDGWGSVIRKG